MEVEEEERALHTIMWIVCSREFFDRVTQGLREISSMSGIGVSDGGHCLEASS
uniref:Uncharacterized protein n=1 Tax=Peronospora matthiolae TaxID=2874970 RepID=A0AAV1U176_9STRA